MLEVANLQVAYGAAPAIWDVSIAVARGELVCVVGPNGAGKSTLINVIAGLHRARGGSIRFDGQDITQLASHRFCATGIAIVPEGRRLFTGMSVRDNLELGSFLPRPRPPRRRRLEPPSPLVSAAVSTGAAAVSADFLRPPRERRRGFTSGSTSSASGGITGGGASAARTSEATSRRRMPCCERNAEMLAGVEFSRWAIQTSVMPCETQSRISAR